MNLSKCFTLHIHQLYNRSRFVDLRAVRPPRSQTTAVGSRTTAHLSSSQRNQPSRSFPLQPVLGEAAERQGMAMPGGGYGGYGGPDGYYHQVRVLSA